MFFNAMIVACYPTNPQQMEAVDDSSDAMEKPLSERWGITRVDAEGAEPAPDGADSHSQKCRVPTPARSDTAKPKVRPSPKVRAKAKAAKTAKATPKKKAGKVSTKNVAIAKRKASRKAAPKHKVSPKAAPKHKDEVQRKLHSVSKLNPMSAKTFVNSSVCQNKTQLPLFFGPVQGIFRCTQRSQKRWPRRSAEQGSCCGSASEVP